MARRPSNMRHQFSEVPRADIPRSAFDRTSGHKTTFDAGYLIPVYVDEALPGDTKTMRYTSFARLATPIYPLMDNMRMSMFWFAVPVRLVWSNWEKFHGAQDNPGDSISYTVPTMPGVATTGYSALTLYDYMGIPPGIPDLEHISLPMRCYNLIWNEWFRDQNLQNSVVVDTDDGPDDPADYVLLRRGKRHDYFTSALPWPQKGDAVSLPLGTANVLGLGTGNQTFPTSSQTVYETGQSASTTFAKAQRISLSGGANEYAWIEEDPDNTGFPNLRVDASSVTINQLRQSFQIQRLLERDARSGTRYTEIIKAHFGVTSPDARLQRPEYLGGSVDDVIVHPVPQQSETGTTAQGNMAAFGTVVANGSWHKSFTEHCYIIGLASVQADLTYQQGLERMWSRSTRYDFYYPVLAQLGEQTILNKEIYAVGSGGATDDDVFGYQERYAEYRYKPSRISGQLRSTHATPLDAWHLSQEFSALPSLNSTFIEDNPPVDRVIADATDPHFIYDGFFRLRDVRPMPVYGVPGLIDHF